MNQPNSPQPPDNPSGSHRPATLIQTAAPAYFLMAGLIYHSQLAWIINRLRFDELIIRTAGTLLIALLPALAWYGLLRWAGRRYAVTRPFWNDLLRLHYLPLLLNLGWLFPLRTPWADTLASVLMIGGGWILFHDGPRWNRPRPGSLLLLAVGALFLLAPVVYMDLALLEPGFLPWWAPFTGNLSAAALAGGSFLIVQRFWPRLAGWLLAGWLLLFFFFNFASAAHYRATGFPLGPSTFLHLDWVAFRVFVMDYTGYLVLFIGACATLIFTVYRLNRPVPGYFQFRTGAMLLLGGLVVLGLSVRYIPVQFKLATPALAVLMYPKSFLGETQADFLSTLVSTRFNGDEIAALRTLGVNLRAPRLGDFKPPTEKKNLILIYLESFQENLREYKRDDGVLLMPNLNRFAESGQLKFHPRFFSSISGSINGLVVSQCGVNVHMEDGNFSKSRDESSALLSEGKVVCLSDILRAHGYFQSFFIGSSLEFSGLHVFTRFHGYDENIGQFILSKNKPVQQNVWGLHDTDLMRAALEKVKELEQRQPFNLTMMTINSHLPGYRAPDCPVYEAGKSLLNGFHCTDQAVGGFLDSFFASPLAKNTIVALVADHTIFPSNVYGKELDPKLNDGYFGKIILGLYDPDNRLPKTFTTPGYQPDLSPTLLTLLGFSGPDFINGKSLLGSRGKHQRMLAPTFEIRNGQSYPPRRHGNPLNICPTEKAAQVSISLNTETLSECQLKRIYYAGQKVMLGLLPDL